jgi:hypothetical protein
MGAHGHVKLNREQVEIKKDSLWSKLWIIGAVLALAGLGGAFATMPDDRTGLAKFWTSYATALSFALALGLGGLFFCILQHITRASWSVVVRRLAENLALTLPFTALLSLPIYFGGESHHENASHHAASDGGHEKKARLGEACSPEAQCLEVLACDAGKCVEKVPSKFPGSHSIYEWTHTDVVQNDVMLSAKAPYLNEGSQKTRIAFYIVVWSLLVWIFVGSSYKQDSAKDPEVLAHRMRWWAPLGISAFAMTTTFAAFDILMSLDPHWFSTIFGVYYFTGAAVTIHSLLVVLCVLLQRSGYLNGVVSKEHYHDLGKFMFGFTVFWAYIAFSQYFLIWYASIPEETQWFDYRGHGDWLTLSIVLVLGRFILPWFALLRQPIKRTPAILVVIAGFIMLMEFIDLFWLVQPAYAHHQGHYFKVLGDKIQADHFHKHIDFAFSDLLTLLGFVGVILAVFGWALTRYALVPVQDPRLDESLNHENR